jgi:predicted ArsR family transcriptional regulator
MDLPPAAGSHVLTQQTRARLFSLLGELKRPASTEELAGELGLHPNGVRVHLERLREAGLVVRTRTLRPRGRPRHEWSVAPDAEPAGDPPRAYADLVRWFARAFPAHPNRLRELESAGREIGQDLAPKDAESLEGALLSTLSALGFRPELNGSQDGVLACRLGNCPYRDAARERPQVVCTLHRGITLGLLDVIQPTATLTDFVPGDPDQGGCLIEVHTDSSSGTSVSHHTE